MKDKNNKLLIGFSRFLRGIGEKMFFNRYKKEAAKRLKIEDKIKHWIELEGLRIHRFELIGYDYRDNEPKNILHINLCLDEDDFDNEEIYLKDFKEDILKLTNSLDYIGTFHVFALDRNKNLIRRK